MAKVNRKRFERLTWEVGQPVPAPPLPRHESYKQATAALLALSGFQCWRCHGPLQEGKGYVCCGYAHCPFCGVGGPDIFRFCLHQALIHELQNEQWIVPMSCAWAKVYPHDLGTTAYDSLFDLVRPAHPPHKGSPGYRVWRPDQIDAAYSPDVRPHVETLFDPHLTSFCRNRLGPILFPDGSFARSKPFAGHPTPRLVPRAA